MILSIFDLDSTLYITPLPTDLNREILSVYRGYEKSGWWGKAESLDTELFDIKPNPWILEKYDTHTKNGDYKVLMTGRIKKLESAVRKVIEQDGFIFKELHLADGRKTIDFKVSRIKSLIEKLKPTEVFFYDDRTEHIPTFRKVGDEIEDTLGIPFRLFHVIGFNGYELKYKQKLR
tara:strand:+ start:49996 stop:50523 length:528 start_codon:yes stop_codon:yes gene_type:complete